MEHTTTHLRHPYLRLALMALGSFVIMYGLMYAMVNSFANVLPNINQFYMAGLMTSPMILIELLLMQSMYPNKRVNTVIAIGSLAALALFFLLIRFQIGVNDRQFVRSMIPHHAGALQMCQHANLARAELHTLCASIITNQTTEIEFMRTFDR